MPGAPPQGSSVLRLGICRTTGLTTATYAALRVDTRAHVVYCHTAALGYALIDGREGHPCDIARAVWCWAGAPSNHKD